MKARPKFRFLVIAALLALTMRACVLETVRVSDDSMLPVFADDDVALVCKACYGLRVPGSGAMLLEWKAPAHGDLVVVAGAGDPPTTLLRRITALPGETAKLEDGSTVELKPGEYFLSAEKKEGTVDSRKIGPVPRRTIVGKVTHSWNGKTPSKEGDSQVQSADPNRRILRPVL